MSEISEEFETITERIIPPNRGKPEYPAWVREETPVVPEDAITTTLDSDETVTAEIIKDSPQQIRARRFLELVKTEGLTPGAAADKCRTTLKELNKEIPNLKEKLKALLEEGQFPAIVRKEMVRAGLNKIFIRNVSSGDLKKQKVAISAAREIAKDPDVGLNLPPTTVGTVIDMGQLGKLFANMQPIPGLEAILENGAEESLQPGSIPEVVEESKE